MQRMPKHLPTRKADERSGSRSGETASLHETYAALHVQKILRAT